MTETIVQGPVDVVLVGGLNNLLQKQSLSQVKKEIEDVMEMAMKNAHHTAPDCASSGGPFL